MSKQSWRGSTLLNPEPPVLVSCGGLEKPNLITIGWTGTICTQPSMVSISVRPERYSHHLIQESGQFAINLPTEALVRSVDWCGVKSGRDVDKFVACGLHSAPGSVLTDCPILEESPVNLECKVTQVIPLGSHDLFLAEVVACDVDESLLDENGKLCLEKAKLTTTYRCFPVKCHRRLSPSAMRSLLLPFFLPQCHRSKATHSCTAHCRRRAHSQCPLPAK